MATNLSDAPALLTREQRRLLKRLNTATTLSDAPVLLTRDQAAEYLGIKPQTLAVWATTHRYQLPFIKVGRSVRYRVSDLDAFLEQRTVS